MKKGKQHSEKCIIISDERGLICRLEEPRKRKKPRPERVKADPYYISMKLKERERGKVFKNQVEFWEWLKSIGIEVAFHYTYKVSPIIGIIKLDDKKKLIV